MSFEAVVVTWFQYVALQPGCLSSNPSHYLCLSLHAYETGIIIRDMLVKTARVDTWKLME